MKEINLDALFCDETEGFRNPCEADAGDKVELIFRTARDDADAVYYIECGHEEKADTKKRLLCFACDTLFDFYKTEITVGSEPICYYFQIEKKEGEESVLCYYSRMGAARQENREAAFRITPGFHVPDWVKGAVMYQIYIDRFRNGDPSNDVETNEYVYLDEPVKKVADWNAPIEAMDVRRFYGGDLQGVWERLDYLKALRVEAIYLNPIFVSPSNHKYDCQDYDHIDPHLTVLKKDSDKLVNPDAADNQDALKYSIRTASRENLEASDDFFRCFVEAAHERGIRIILDGVFNHCGSFNKWLDAEQIYQKAGGYPQGAFISANSPYRNFFKFRDEEKWPYNKSYDGWWGHDTLPKLNYEESPELYQYIMDVAKKWVSPPYNVDGWRLDVAADLGRSGDFNHHFWKDFRRAVKNANPEAVILAEHYGDPSGWLKGDEWDTVMNYDAFMEPVSWFLTGMEKHSLEKNDALFGDGQAFFEAMSYHMSRMQTPSLMAAMNELSNHDHSRFMTRTNRQAGRLAEAGYESAAEGISFGIFRQGVVMAMTWPGAPTIYYGDESGVCGWTDPDSRRTYPWGRENQELIEFHRYMTEIRERNPAFRKGSLKPLVAMQNIISYGRFDETGRCVVAVNTGSTGKFVSVPVWLIGMMDGEKMCRRMLTYESGYNVGAVYFPVKNGMCELELPEKGSVILTAEAD